MDLRSSLNLVLKLERLFLPPVLWIFFPEEEFVRYLDFLFAKGVMKLNLYLLLFDGVFFTDFTIFVFVFTW